MVEACVSAYAQTVAMCAGDHWRLNDKNGRERITTSSLSRVLRFPNDYETISDFKLNLTRSLYMDGNAYALALRNQRFEIDELHIMDPNQSRPQLAQNGEIFYQLAGNDVIERRLGERAFVVPARDVLHVRLHADRRYPRPLAGLSPIDSIAADVMVGDTIKQQQTAFYMNEARPSAVISTDLQLDKDQTQALRDRWNDKAKGMQQGGTPILTHGLKVMPWAVGGKDAATAEILKMSNEQIALAFRVPLPILGLGGQNFNSTETLMQFWIATGLGFCLNHIEESFDLLFGLKGQPDEYTEFSTDALLRSQFKDRIEGLTKGVIGGLYAPNEARQLEGLEAKPWGDEPRVQQQVVPLSQIGETPPAPAPNAPPPAPAADAPKPAPPTNDNTKAVTDADIQREVRNVLAAAARIGRRMSA